MTALVVLAVLVGALAQSVSGIGFSLVCMPFLVGALGAHEGVRLGVVLSLLVNVGCSRGITATWTGAVRCCCWRPLRWPPR